ncbi:Cyclin-A3-4 [Echinococcus granulosus]|uniref:Cyclins n=1 Tax=Echinococcus granulosus TaxID=6210 RepID=A0A068WKX2_ECHGR|nr:Cyclin-A3-4 [Echinococcus granulosus]CDS20430.1 cyclins [Echinococcus granulosus]
MSNDGKRCGTDSSACNPQASRNDECSPRGGRCNQGASPSRGHSITRRPRPINGEQRRSNPDTCHQERALGGGQESVPAPKGGRKSDPKPANFITSPNPGIGEVWKAGTCDDVHGFNLARGRKSDPAPAKYIISPNPGIGEAWKAGTAKNTSGFCKTESSLPRFRDSSDPEGGSGRNSNYLGLVEMNPPARTGEQQLNDFPLYTEGPAPETQDLISPYLLTEDKVVPLERSDIEEDYDLTKNYKNDFLLRSKLTPALRAALFDWLTTIQVYMAFDTTTLHIAALLVDRYTWTHIVIGRQYLLVTLAAFLVAANLTSQTFNEADLIDLLLQLSNNTFKKLELCNMNLELRQDLVSALLQATPHHFLKNCMLAMDDVFTDDDRRRFVALCLYCFDLGLLDWELAKYPASMKCAAVVYLVRKILRNYCTCLHGGLHDTNSGCAYHRITPWSPELLKAIHHEDTPELHEVANIYLEKLNEAQFLINLDTPEFVPDCASPFEAAFRKHSDPAYLRISVERIRTMPFMKT